MAIMITAIRHVGIVVQDLPASEAFWCGLMGFVVQRRMEESRPFIDVVLGMQDVRLTTVKLAAPDGNLIELLKFHSHADGEAWAGAFTSTGLTHVAFTVTDLPAMYSRLRKSGLRFNTPPQQSADGRALVAFCVGPEGIVLELVEELQ